MAMILPYFANMSLLFVKGSLFFADMSVAGLKWIKGHNLLHLKENVCVESTIFSISLFSNALFYY